MKHFLDFVVRSLVDNPDDVQISEISHEGETIYRVGLHASDIGRMKADAENRLAVLGGLGDLNVVRVIDETAHHIIQKVFHGCARVL